MTHVVIDTPLYQWDRGRTVTITLTKPVVQEVHFARKGEKKALVVKPYKKGTKTMAEIPDILLQKSGKLNVYLVIGTEDNEQTIYDRSLNITEREKPEDYIYTEEEKLVWADLEERISQLEEDGFAKKEYVDESIAKLPAIQYVEQTLTEEQKAQARQNIGSDLPIKPLPIKELKEFPTFFTAYVDIEELIQENYYYCETLSYDGKTYIYMGAVYCDDGTIKTFTIGTKTTDTFFSVINRDYDDYKVIEFYQENRMRIIDLTDKSTASNITITEDSIFKYLPTRGNGEYTTPYEPQYDADPATKKYVDDNTRGLITSVNGQTGDVVLTADDVDAIPADALEAFFDLVPPTFLVSVIRFPENYRLFSNFNTGTSDLEEIDLGFINRRRLEGLKPRFIMGVADDEDAEGRILSTRNGTSTANVDDPTDWLEIVVDFYENEKRVILRITADSIEEIPAPSAGIPLPPTAEVGQYFRVSAVDETGNVTAVEAVDAPSGGGEWALIADVTIEEDVFSVEITEGIPKEIDGIYYRLDNAKYVESSDYNYICFTANGVSVIPVNLGIKDTAQMYDVLAVFHKDGSCHAMWESPSNVDGSFKTSMSISGAASWSYIINSIGVSCIRGEQLLAAGARLRIFVHTRGIDA